MAKQVQIRRGPLSNLITLVEGELGFVTDTKELVVGASGGNQFMAKKTHQHTKADIVDFAHQHSKSDIVDFAHQHVKADITDFPVSLPASDVYSWAKQVNKPSYAYSEITGRPTLGTVAPINLPNDSSKYMNGVGQFVTPTNWSGGVFTLLAATTSDGAISIPTLESYNEILITSRDYIDSELGFETNYVNTKLLILDLLPVQTSSEVFVARLAHEYHGGTPVEILRTNTTEITVSNIGSNSQFLIHGR